MKLKYFFVGTVMGLAGIVTCECAVTNVKPKIGAPQQKAAVGGGVTAGGYQKTSDALQAITSAVPRFAPDNFFLNGISADGKTVWYGLLAGIQGYVNNQIAQLSKAESSRDKALYMNAMKTIQDISNQLINDVTITRNSNEQFKKGINADAWKKAKQQVDKLAARTQELETIETSVKSNPKDSPVAKDIKKVINMLALTLKLTIEKVGKDFKKVTPSYGKALPTLPVKK